MEAYRNAFEPLAVPDDMLGRIMARAQVPAEPAPKRQKRRIYSAVALAACLALVLCTTAVLRPWTEEPQPTHVQGVNPIQNTEGILELAAALPFPLKAPTQLPEGYAFEHASSILGALGQIVYLKGEDKLTYRMAEGEADISGDFNQYAETSTVDGITLKGDGGSVSLATWSDGTYSYSVSALSPLSAEMMLAVCAHVEELP